MAESGAVVAVALSTASVPEPLDWLEALIVVEAVSVETERVAVDVAVVVEVASAVALELAVDVSADSMVTPLACSVEPVTPVVGAEVVGVDVVDVRAGSGMG